MSDLPAAPDGLSAWHGSTAQQVVRYEALFTLLEDILGLNDIAAIAQQVNKQWKYVANVASWRLLLADQRSFLVIDGFAGRAKIEQVAEQDLPPWDRHHWKQQRPALVKVTDLAPGLMPPAHLVGKNIPEIQVLPLVRSDQCNAILTVSSRHDPFTDLDNKYIRLLGYYFADRVQAILLQKRTVELLHTKATRDSLTGILNRGTILEQLEAMLSQAKQNAYQVSIIIADIDYFKVINDSYGHQTGDKVLREVAQRLQSEIRGSDAVGRYGGEEFLIILERCGAEQVATVAERFHRTITANTFTAVGFSTPEIKVTISGGTASTDGSMGYNAFALIKVADDALYKSKAGGRNRITLGERR
jgi:diguanylate cyclase (GGDEF)-like protein